MDKKIVVICLLTFFIGCAGGGALAYANHQKGLEEQSLLASISQTQDNWEVEQFIRNQEEQRPEGLEESQIATGSRYTGITYNNVSVASAHESSQENDLDVKKDEEKKEGLLSGLFSPKTKSGENTDSTTGINEQDPAAATASYSERVVGRVVIQSGSLNIRTEGSIDGGVIGQAYKDELVEIIEKDGAWYQIVTGEGVEGFVSSNYIEIVEE